MRLSVIGLNYAPEQTGIAPYTAGAAGGLTARGHDLVVITGYPHYPKWRIADGYSGLSRKEVVDGVRVLRLRHPVPASAGVIGRSLMELVFGLRAVLTSWHAAEVVLSISPALLGTAVVVARARLTRRPVVVWVHDIYTLGVAQTGSGARGLGLIKKIETYALRNADRIVVVHERFGTYLSKELGVDPARIDVVRNWTHLDQPAARSVETRASHGWDDDAIVVLHAGNMGAKQNLESVVRASELAAKQGSKVRFVLMGDGHRRRPLEQMGSNSNLQFIDPLPEAEFASALASADILLVNELPGMTEMSIPSKLTSYFSTGLPVLAAVDAASVTAAEIEAATAGIRVDPDAPAELLAAAEKLAKDPDLANRLGASGLAYRKTVLSANTAITALEATLRQAAER